MRGHRGVAIVLQMQVIARVAGRQQPRRPLRITHRCIEVDDGIDVGADADARGLAQGLVPELARKADGNRKGGGPDGLGAGRP